MRLRWADLADKPLIDPNFLAEAEDVRTSIEGVKISREVMHSPAFWHYVKREHFPGTEVKTQADSEAYARQYDARPITRSALGGSVRTRGPWSIRCCACAA